MLLTRSPLYSGSCPPFLARLACVRHAASVRSEPGSNSPVELEHALAPHGAEGGRIERAFANLARTNQSHVVHDHYAWDLLRTAYSLEKGRYYLVFKDRVLLRADPLL